MSYILSPRRAPGERHSGTNLVVMLLDANFELGARHPLLQETLGRTPKHKLNRHVGSGCTAHKHLLQPVDGRNASVSPGEALPDMSRTLAVVVVRNVFDWCGRRARRGRRSLLAPVLSVMPPCPRTRGRTRKMCEWPWETGFPHGEEVTLEQCLRFAWVADTTSLDDELRGETMLGVRRLKYASWRGLPWPNVEFVHYECLLHGAGEGATAWLASLERRYGLRRKAAARAAPSQWLLPVNQTLPYHGAMDWQGMEKSSMPVILSDVVDRNASLDAWPRDARKAMQSIAYNVLLWGRLHPSHEAEMGYGHAVENVRTRVAACASLRALSGCAHADTQAIEVVQRGMKNVDLRRYMAEALNRPVV